VPDGTLVLEIPEAIAWSEAGDIQVSGQAKNLDTLTLNGDPVTITDDTFVETVTLTRGINHLVASGIDIGGDPLTDEATVLAGTFASPGNTMPSVLGAHLGSAGLDAVGSYAATALDPSLLLKKKDSLNPIYENHPILGNWMEADLAGMTFQDAEIDITPTGGALEVTVTLPELVIDLAAYGELVWIDYDMDLQMTAAAAVITAEIMIEAVDGGLEVSMVAPDISLEGFTYDLSILPSFIESYFFVETIQGTVEDLLIAQSEEMVPAMIDEALTGLEFAYTMDLLGSELALSAAFADVDVTAAGVSLDMDVNVAVPGSGTVSYAGYLAAPESSTPAPSTDSSLSLVVSDDLLNRTLFEMWRGGAMEVTLSTEDGSLEPTTLEGLPLETATVTISPQLPPVIVDGESGLQLQAGALDVVASTPGASFGELIEMRLTIMADATIAVADGILQPSIGDVSIAIEVLESDWVIHDGAVSELVAWALPPETLSSMASEVAIALPSLGGVTVSTAEFDRSQDAFYSAIFVEFSLE